MSFYIRVVDPPAEEPLGLDEVKAQLRVDYSDEDGLISGYIVAAREQVEADTGRALMTQTLELGLDTFPGYGGHIRIPRGQLQSIESFIWTDTAMVDTTMVSGVDYQLNQYSEPAELVLPYAVQWPGSMLAPMPALRIRFIAGWTDASLVPQSCKQAMQMLIGDWYKNREDVEVGRTSTIAVQMPNGVTRLLASQRMNEYTPFFGQPCRYY